MRSNYASTDADTSIGSALVSAACSFASSSLDNEVRNTLPSNLLISSRTLSGVDLLTKMKMAELPGSRVLPIS